MLDVRSLYGAGRTENLTGTKVIIFEKKDVKYGMIVDSVESILSFSDEEKIKIPEILYKGSSTDSDIKDDVKFAVEVELNGEKNTLLVLNLDPLADRVGLVSSSTAQAV
jgi:purine-binding chemotaxis protein CheW